MVFCVVGVVFRVSGVVVHAAGVVFRATGVLFRGAGLSAGEPVCVARMMLYVTRRQRRQRRRRPRQQRRRRQRIRGDDDDHDDGSNYSSIHDRSVGRAHLVIATIVVRGVILVNYCRGCKQMRNQHVDLVGVLDVSTHDISQSLVTFLA